MRVLAKCLEVIAVLGILIAAIGLFHPKPPRRLILRGGNDPDTIRQNAVDSMERAICDFNSQRRIVEQYQRRQSTSPESKP